jgi:VanZ family protein
MIAKQLWIIKCLGAWSCIVAIAILSLLPADYLMRTDLGGHAEHVLAYAGTAFISTLAWRRRRISQIAIALIAYAAVLETLQQFSPGRSSNVIDFMFSAMGVAVGIAALALVNRLQTAWLRPK